MSAVSQVVRGVPSAGADGGEEPRGGVHTAPGADYQAGRAPNTDGARRGQDQAPHHHQQELATSSAGDVSRESADGEPPARYITTTHVTSSRTPRLKQLNFDGRERLHYTRSRVRTDRRL